MKNVLVIFAMWFYISMSEAYKDRVPTGKPYMFYLQYFYR